MNTLTKEQEYNFLRNIKRAGAKLSSEQEQFIQDYTQKKLHKTMSQPDELDLFNRMKDR
jgi:hypothetical protein